VSSPESGGRENRSGGRLSEERVVSCPESGGSALRSGVRLSRRSVLHTATLTKDRITYCVNEIVEAFP
jgi:hypothetical protein